MGCMSCHVTLDVLSPFLTGSDPRTITCYGQGPNSGKSDDETGRQLTRSIKLTVEVMGLNAVLAWIFFRPYFYYCLSSVHYCEDHFHIHFFIRNTHMSFLCIYSHSFIPSRLIRNQHTDHLTAAPVSQRSYMHGFKSRTGLNFFSGLIFTTA